MYVLNVTIPSEDVDALYEPRKKVLGYKVSCLEPELFRAHVLGHRCSLGLASGGRRRVFEEARLCVW